MKAKMIFLITVLAVMFGGTSAIGLAQVLENETPEPNTEFSAEISTDGDEATIEYSVCSLTEGSLTEECELVEIEVTPNEDEELNHGSFVSAFAEHDVLRTGSGKGCLVRFVAQSDWGQPDGTYEPISEEAFCAFNSNKPDSDELEVEVEVEGEDTGEGKPEWAGKGKPEGAGGDDDAETDDDDSGPPDWVGAPGKSNSDT
ncbi:MAG: hypothetical protein WD532_03805 [Acidimicrobiia bacterium]